MSVETRFHNGNYLLITSRSDEIDWKHLPKPSLSAMIYWSCSCVGRRNFRRLSHVGRELSGADNY